MDIKRVPDYPDYGVDRKGNVYSFKAGKVKILKASIVKGYEQVGLLMNKKWQKKKVHRLVAEAFIPNPENKSQVNHKNGIKTDNNVENLEWCTRIENVQHAISNNLFTPYYGKKAKRLTKEQILELRKFIEKNRKLPREQRLNREQIAEHFKITMSQICRVIKISKGL